MNRAVAQIGAHLGATLPVLLLAVALTLAACSVRSRVPAVTPSDPPPVPIAKPQPPVMPLSAATYPAAASGIAGLIPPPLPKPHFVSAVARTSAVASPYVAPSSVARPVAPPPRKPLRSSAYHVKRGDTVYGIARRLGLPIRSLIDANGLAPPYRLKLDQRLIVPSPRLHRVVAGETIYGLSRLYNVDLRELVRLNDVRPPYTIAAGDTMLLPAISGSEAPAAAIAVVSPGPAVTAPPATPTSKPSAGTQLAAIPRALPGPVPQPPPRSQSRFHWPVAGKVISSYGSKDGGLHNDGINIAANRGDPVQAAENGVVAYVGNELRGFGNLILLKHAGGWITAYAHNDRLLVRRGQIVQRGETIAYVGSSGNVSSPQLHFEIRKGSRALDPSTLLGTQRATR
ncbi:MAG: peptidoglycan DD-metalloendopeptidase family protein [Kiloniellales bacterium]